ncbi:FadR/GntR family transcriptional regulator [Parasedimentitalea psychrophila]|uniref:FCD domain-containing protein n=1 Tax=Parasedimentitalea psychrophila TaxID=2997337 RepID=A0A9Y2L2P1_9RHOB|nr:FCD domain-containing protein [Parasedimentitalea psychrophila]WIY26571.1 FCD domain-containing protein [Parasedimentitalea psychrophila]
MKTVTNCVIGSSMPSQRASEALEKLSSYIEEHNFSLNARIPPERMLCEELGMTRSDFRSAMSVLEGEGRVWRQVGRGTFIGARSVLNLSEVRYLSGITTPKEIGDARLVIEPKLAGLAALNGVSTEHGELRRCNRRCREAKDWRIFEAWDNRFHYAVATATRNKLLMTVFETLNAVRRSHVWQTQRTTSGPSASHPSHAEHNAIYDAIVQKKPDDAAEAMRVHLDSVSSRLILQNASA